MINVLFPKMNWYYIITALLSSILHAASSRCTTSITPSFLMDRYIIILRSGGNILLIAKRIRTRRLSFTHMTGWDLPAWTNLMACSLYAFMIKTKNNFSLRVTVQERNPFIIIQPMINLFFAVNLKLFITRYHWR